eukprot:3069047-Rhodomonas_salina.1
MFFLSLLCLVAVLGTLGLWYSCGPAHARLTYGSVTSVAGSCALMWGRVGAGDDDQREDGGGRGRGGEGRGRGRAGGRGR